MNSHLNTVSSSTFNSEFLLIFIVQYCELNINVYQCRNLRTISQQYSALFQLCPCPVQLCRGRA